MPELSDLNTNLKPRTKFRSYRTSAVETALLNGLNINQYNISWTLDVIKYVKLSFVVK